MKRTPTRLIASFRFQACLPVVAALALLGARSEAVEPVCTGVIITEIMYNPSSDQGSDFFNEWVEILNYSCDPVDLLGWTIEDGSTSQPDLLFPLDGGSFVLGPEEYALIIDGTGSDVLTNPAWNIAPGTRIFGTDDAAIGNGLSNGGEMITIKDEEGDIVDLVVYDDTDASGCGNEADGPVAGLLTDLALARHLWQNQGTRGIKIAISYQSRKARLRRESLVSKLE